MAAAARRLAAQPQVWAAGHADAIATLMRRALTRTRAPILSSLRRMVGHEKSHVLPPGTRPQQHTSKICFRFSEIAIVKPAAPVVCLDGLCAAVRLAPHRPAPHAVRQSDLRHHSSQAAQDRRPGARECPPQQGCDGVSVSGSPYLGLRCQASRRCRQRAGLARLTHVAATRNPRGITPGPTETASRLS